MPPIHAASELSAMEEMEEMELEEGFGSVSGWRSSEPERRADRMYFSFVSLLFGGLKA